MAYKVWNSYVPLAGSPAQRFLGTLWTALTEAERQIVQLVCDGVSDKEIARRLDLSEDAVKVHIHKIYQKLAMRNREALRGRSAE
jgi:DNA-binding NarL/FixJ family response regulator